MKIPPLVLLILVETLCIVAIHTRDSPFDAHVADSEQSTSFLRKAKLAAPRKLSSGLLQLIEEVALKGADNPSSYHSKAFTWLKNSSNLLNLTDEHIIQRYALACVYYNTNAVRTAYTDAEYGAGVKPPGWKEHDSWLSTVDECRWYGITCDENGKVLAIDLSSNRLTGQFPPEVSLLNDSLLRLDLTDNLVNNIGPDWTSFLGDLVNLQFLYIGSTNFDSDGIPLEIGKLSKLVEFDCSYSLFYGPLSGEPFSNMPNLKTLILSGNGYNSSVPDEIAMLPDLQHLFIEEAFLDGNLSFIEKMPKIVELRLDFNPGLTGDIPTTIAVANTLETLSATSCGLTGSIPAEMGLLKKVKNLVLYGNHLDGEIPTELGKLSRMETFEVELNDITGPMPAEICKLTLPGEGWLKTLEADCNGQVKCSCCTACFGPP